MIIGAIASLLGVVLTISGTAVPVGLLLLMGGFLFLIPTLFISLPWYVILVIVLVIIIMLTKRK